ncbi:MAG TPA: PD-(D/E)XK nuclease family protein [Oscillospiraceae bacterium]|nr:PD-(D/E)XK nuclease family protein [Oscillospiraceae bacterium]
MLHLILGRAGSGKTQTVRLSLRDLAQEENKKCMLLVPEQYSFESERAMLRLLGAKDEQKVQVTSFTRLTDLVFRKYGGLAGRRLDDGGRNILMSLALEQVSAELPLYRKHVQTPELVNMMLAASAEMKMCAITPNDLSAAAAAMQDGTLKQKTTELSLIFSAYDALVAQSYLDPLDDLTRLKKLLQQQSFFSGYTVMLDSFKGFTVQELDILELMIQQADDVTVSLCTDMLDDPEHGMGLFSQVRRTAKQVLQLARENGVKVAAPVVLESGKRFQHTDLAALEESAFRVVHTTYTGKTENVILYDAKTAYDESAFVASSIRSLVIQKGYRYRDFAIITRSLDNYRGNLDVALEQYEIPYFMDKPRAIDTEPLMHLVLCAFQIVKSGFQSDDIFAYLKTGLAGLSSYEISLLENYTYLWNLSGKKWQQPWNGHPQGFVETMTEHQAKQLEKINELRAQVVKPLIGFAAAIADANGEGMAKAIYALLIDIDVPTHLKELCHSLKESGQTELAEQQLRLWDLLMNILDQTALVLKNTYLPHARYAELLRLVILAGSISSIPQGLDEVTVGAADRMRPAEPKVVFLIGAAQGEFPLTPSANGVFSDDERRALISLGLPLSSTLEDTAVEERFLAYAAMTSPSERLYITWPCAEISGEAKTVSSIVNEAKTILPNIMELNEQILPQETFANAKEPAFELTARQWKQNSLFSATLKACFAQREEYAPRMNALELASQKAPAMFADKTKAKALFDSSKHISATQIENYHLCRFQYVCRYGLGAKERIPAEMNALEYGSLMHFLLENMFRTFGSEQIHAMSKQELKTKITAAINQYIEIKMGGSQDKTPRFNFLFGRLADSAQVIISHIAAELSQSEFKPAAYELELKEGSEFPPLTIHSQNGETVTIDGKIDRVDIMEKNGERYIRVIDYKTGKKEFKLGDVLNGINMQMLIYLAAVIEDGALQPAGVLYMPATRPIIAAARGTANEDLQKEVNKKLRMNGVVLEDTEIIHGMEADAAGKYIPVALKDEEIAKADNALSNTEIKSTIHHIKGLVSNMEQTLHNGDVAADPLKGDYDACAYCPYFAVCGHEKNDSGRERFRCSKADTLKQIEENTNGGEGE